MKDSCVIVGGGVVGIVAANILSQKYKKVHIIEKSESIGGLLVSKNYNRKVYFDYGPHLFTSTGIKKIDEILFGPIDDLEKNWLIHDFLYDSSFFNKWNLGSPLVDARNLSNIHYKKAIEELMQVKHLNLTDDYNDYIISNFGKTLKKNIFDRVIKKIYGSVDLEKISINSIKIFGLHRILAFTSELTLKLKKKIIYDERIAFHLFEQDKRNIKFLYPKGEKGVGVWVQKQVENLSYKNVFFHYNETVKKINYDKKKITSVKLQNGKEIPLDFCLWTVPPAMGLLAGNIKFKGDVPKTRSNLIFHFEFDKGLSNNKSTYLWNWDPSFKTFRVTLYPNMNKKIEKNFSYLTVEVLCDLDEVKDINYEIIISELKILKIIPKNSNVIFAKTELLKSTIPIITQNYQNQVYQLNTILENSFLNLKTAGRYSGRAWFMNDVLKDLYNLLN